MFFIHGHRHIFSRGVGATNSLTPIISISVGGKYIEKEDIDMRMDLKRISRISTNGILLIIDVGDSKNLFGFIFPNSDNCILTNRHRQNRISFIINMFPNQIHSPYTPKSLTNN